LGAGEDVEHEIADVVRADECSDVVVHQGVPSCVGRRLNESALDRRRPVGGVRCCPNAVGAGRGHLAGKSWV
jgi:hypothetical protein